MLESCLDQKLCFTEATKFAFTEILVGPGRRTEHRFKHTASRSHNVGRSSLFNLR